MIYPKNFEDKIGFSPLRSYLKKRCDSKIGENEVDKMSFLCDRNSIVAKLNQTQEFLGMIQNGIDFPLSFISDSPSELNRIRLIGTYLSENQLFDLKRSLLTINEIVNFFKSDDENRYPALAELCNNLQTFPAIINEIDSILDKFGNIKDNASQELLHLKKSLNATSSNINSTLRRILAKGRDEGVLEKDVMPSVRDGRLVIPVPPMYKRKIQGIVHDESATGKTVYIEPAEIVEANNAIRELEASIKREIIKILISCSDILRPHIDELLESCLILGELDFVRAKAKVANELGGIMPNISEKQELEWYHAIHPILYISLKEQHKDIVPLDITLNEKQRILLISGPNAGGKSVCLKTVGTIQYMLQCGLLPLVYSNSHMGIFNDIFIDIGDEQSLEDDLSTYSSHLKNMKYFMTNGSNATLILIDEFGGGTEPQIGGAIAQAILSNINSKKMFGVITTHYQNLKHFAENTEGIINGAMLYDRNEMRPLFKLSIGYPGSSFAIEIARKIGLPQNVISNAQDIVGSDYVNMDKYLLDITRDRKYWENKRQDIRIKEKRLSGLVDKYETEIGNLQTERKDILRKAKAEAKEILDRSNSSIENTIRDIKVAQADKQKTKDIRQQLEEFKKRILNEESKENTPLRKLKAPKNKKQHNSTHKVSTQSLKVDDYVKIEGTNTPGQIISIDGNKATVAFGAMKTQIALARLTKTIMSPTTSSNSQIVNTYDESRKRQLNFSPDIDVRGMRGDEAIQAVTYFLDDALQFSYSRIRILHGTGNGILRQLIRQYLNTVPSVNSYRDENVQLGGAGITVVDLS